MTAKKSDQKDPATSAASQKIPVEPAPETAQKTSQEPAPETIPPLTDPLKTAAADPTQTKIAELTEVSKRALADLQNYKRRIEEERSQFVKLANASLILGILQITDNFDRAFAHMPQELEKNEWVEGVIQIEKQLSETLKKQGLKSIESIGQKFDPNFHEALLHAPGKKDVVIEELEKGYLLNDKVLRPSKVKVGNGEKLKK